MAVAGAPALGDPATFAAGVPHDAIAALRRATPVAWQELRGHTGFHAVLTHAGVVEVARRPDVFSASTGGVVLEDLAPADLDMLRHMLLAMDPPTHTAHRRPLADVFRAKVVAGMEDEVRSTCARVLDAALVAGEVDLVHDVAAPVPTEVVGRLMGVPEDDRPRLHALAERQTAAASTAPAADGAGGGAPTDSSASVEMALYAMELAAARRREPPRPDVTSLLLDADPDGQPMTDADFGSFFVQLVIAGNDTTRSMLTSAVLALLEHPDQLALLRDDRSLVPGAVEEVLRWDGPLHCFRRTATVDTEVEGVPIAAGEKVAMYYTAANRDPAVFADPDRFDVRRDPNPHLAFGIGPHFCLGVHLARLEGRVFLEELLDRVAAIELTGPPERVPSTLTNTHARVPVRLHPA